MRETEKRIRQYRAQLPHIRERIIASLLIFALSIAMVTMSAFAWVTLSVSPEVSGVTTTIAANGNLEIALSNIEGTSPLASAIGDGSGDLTLRNLTWGNLINLSDKDYGLENISLRPATLSKNNLNTNPLYSAVYDSDGRMSTMNNDYVYTKWNWQDEEKTVGEFKIITGDAYGVRAISSVTYTGGNNQDKLFLPLRNEADAKLIMVQGSYRELTSYPGREYYDGATNPYMGAIASLIAIYVNAQADAVLNDGQSVDVVFNGNQDKIDALDDMYEMMQLLYQDYFDIGSLFVDTVAMYQRKKADDAGTMIPKKFTVTELCTMTETAAGKAELLNLGLDTSSYKNLENYVKDIRLFQADLKLMEEYCQKAKTSTDQITWNNHIEAIVNDLMDIPNTYINNKPFNSVVSLLLSEIKSNPLGALNLQGVVDKVVTKNPKVESRKGLVKNFEVLSGEKMSVDNLPIQVKVMGIGLKIVGDFCTNADGNSVCKEEVYEAYGDVTGASSGTTGGSGKASVGDTFGLAVDFWIRSNAPQTYLTLEGNLVREERKVTATLKDGRTVDVLIATVPIEADTGSTITDGEGGDAENGSDTEIEETTPTTKEIEVYLLDDGNYYALSNGEQVTNVDPQNVRNKKTEIIVGYEGTNRIWSDETPGVTSGGLPLYSTSQGSGSCYTFYADPVDAVKILQMLSALKVAFVDQDGKLLAKASLDTVNYVESVGKYTLPLVLEAGSSLSVMTSEGNASAIALLQKDEAMRITALMYLDGDLVENDNVLSASDIEGQFNIQFGSTYSLTTIGDDALYEATRIVSAGFISGSAPTFDYELKDNMPVEREVGIYVNVDGDAPETMTANFIRKINATQGSRQESFSLTYNPATDRWEGKATFKMPGEYVLRSVRMDGLDYDLTLDDPDDIKVTINGFGVQSLVLDDHNQTIMTADSSVLSGLTLNLSSSSIYPQSIKAVFVGDNKEQIIVPLSGYNGTYTGVARFIKSSTYTLQFIELDGVLVNIADTMQQRITIFTGLSAEVYIYDSTPSSFKLNTGETRDIQMAMRIEDNAGNRIEGLESSVNLYYKVAGSSLDQNGINAEMSWNEDAGAYVGTFKIENTGTYSFFSATVDIVNEDGQKTPNTIRSASDAVTIVAFNTDTFGFTANHTEPTQFAPDGSSAHFSLTLANTTAGLSKVYAKIAKVIDTPVSTYAESTESAINREIIDYYAVEGEIVDGRYIFKIPNKPNNSQDGEWVLIALKATGVYDNGVYYGNGSEMGPTGADFDAATGYVELSADQFLDAQGNVLDIKTTVSSKMLYTFSDGLTNTLLGATDLDQDGSIQETEKTGQFMASYPIKNVNLILTDGEGNFLSDAEVTVKYMYDRTNMQSYGSYTTTSAVVPIVEELTLTHTGNGLYTATSENALQLAGDYTISLEVKIDNTTFTPASTNLEGDALPAYKVYSQKPTVTVTATDPKPGTTKRVYSVKTPTSKAQAIQGDFFRFTNYSAIVYIHTPAVGGGYDQEAAEAYAPTITLSLAGVTAGYSEAKMEFRTKNTDSQDSTFTFDATGTAKAEIGKAVTGKRGLLGVDDYPECYPAGRMTQNQINITYGSATYKVDLSHEITIDQPQSPSALIFAGIPDTYKDTKPSQVVGEGSSVTVTLPELYWTATIEEPQNGTWSAYTAVGEVSEVGGQNTKRLAYSTWEENTGACSSAEAHYKYQYFIWTKFESSITAETDIYTQDKKIVQWMINGVKYNAGETVTVVGDGIITAIAVVSDNGAKTFKETTEHTSYKYLYGYVIQGTQTNTTTAPDLSVTLIGTPGTSQNATLASPKLADISKANAATDTPGINTTTDPAGYTDYLK